MKTDEQHMERDEKPVKLTKKGKPDQRSIKSAQNVSKARSKVKAFLQAGKQIMTQGEDDSSGDEVIDLVIRPKAPKHDDNATTEEKAPVRRVPLKQVLKHQEAMEEGDDTDDYYKPRTKVKQGKGYQIRTDEADDKRYDKLMRELEGGRAEQAALAKQIEEMKRGITDATNERQTKVMQHNNDVEIMRKKMLLRF
jgi:hypothetical protein